MIKQRIEQLSEEYFEQIVQYRRYLHQNPELSTKEENTAQFICEKLDEMSLKYKKNVGGYGIYGFVEGVCPEKKCVALRADMDALPINEETNLEFKSKKSGVMHACGHDVHIASLLGAIKILNTLKNSFQGRVMFIFQPSEEFYPGGALKMLNDGIFNEVIPQNIFAFHTTPEMDIGFVGIKEGKAMASTDEIYIDVIGKGGHGATPNLNIDPVLVASHIVVGLQSIVSRNAIPTMPTTVSICRFLAEGRTNITPNKVHLEGIVRTFDEAWRKEIHKLIERISTNIASSFGAKAEVFIDSGYPYLYNDPQLSKEVFAICQDYLGKDKVIALDERMTAEDFAYFAQKAPSCYFRVGTKKKGEEITNLHTSTFDVDEQCLKYAMGLSSFIAIETLNK